MASRAAPWIDGRYAALAGALAVASVVFGALASWNRTFPLDRVALQRAQELGGLYAPVAGFSNEYSGTVGLLLVVAAVVLLLARGRVDAALMGLLGVALSPLLNWAKVLVEKGSGRILGAHLVGHGAEETIHTFALAIEKGTPASEIASRVYAYPTFHSDLKYLV